MSILSGRQSSRPEYYHFLTLDLLNDDNIREVFHNDETIKQSKIVFSNKYGFLVMFYSKGFVY